MRGPDVERIASFFVMFAIELGKWLCVHKYRECTAMAKEQDLTGGWIM